MAGKKTYDYRASTYYSDEETLQFLKNKAGSGKDSSVSAYIYRLITEDRLRSDSSGDRIEDVQNDEKTVLHPQFGATIRMTTHGTFHFQSFRKLREGLTAAANKKFINSTLDSQINAGIIKDFETKTSNIFTPDSAPLCVVILKLYTECSYFMTDDDDCDCHGSFTTTWLLIPVSENLWIKSGGRYKFENIRYISYAELTDKARTTKKTQHLSPILELDRHDNSGSFFIPVSCCDRQKLSESALKKFSFSSLKNVHYIIKGVTASSQNPRASFKIKNESQKTIFLKRMKDSERLMEQNKS